MHRSTLNVLTVMALQAFVHADEPQQHLFILSGQSNMVRLDPKDSFTPMVEAEFGKENVLVVRLAANGQPIRRWYKAWNGTIPVKKGQPQKESAPYGDIYDRLMAQVNEALAGSRPKTVTFVWMQGEADAKEGNDRVYKESLLGLIQQLRDDLDRDDLNYVIGRLSTFGINSKSWQGLRDAQMFVANDSPRGTWIDTDDIDIKGIHYTPAGSRELGQRFAEAAIALIDPTKKAVSYSDSPKETEANILSWPGRKNQFHGFDRYKFKVEDLECMVVVPKVIAEGKPWIWRARFFGWAAEVDIALLKRGFHVAYVDVKHLYGSPEAVARFDTFYDYLTSTRGLAKKPVLEGMSRGGLMVYNWAAKNPEKVNCIYADAPVCDFKSWPGINQAILDAYGLTKEEAEAYTGNPVDNLKPLADAGIPLLHVVGDADTVVPVAENTAVIEKRYRELGGTIEVIHKPGVGHHPHGLDDPQPIVDFILKYTQSSPASER